MLISLLGGLGMFLLGMTLLTDGLKALAGDALRRVLTRFVQGPISGTLWGAVLTTLVQSSTATTLATVGFVSAGMLTLSQAVGVIFGANIGTTTTAWIVSQLGLKVSLHSIAPIFILIGAGVRLLARYRWSNLGTAIAGFGLLFLGIDMLQQGMGGLTNHLSPDDLDFGGGLLERLTLIALGAAITIVMQSSSAAMAATLTALGAGALNLEQAVALAIGQNIGTTGTALLAGLGAPLAARRAAVAHLLFNTVTALVALAALTPLVHVSSWLARIGGAGDAPTVLAIFHTLFNVMGVALLLPLTDRFTALICRLVPAKPGATARLLADAPGQVGPAAQEAARQALTRLYLDAADLVGLGPGSARDARAHAAERDVREIARFVQGLGRAEQSPEEIARQQSLLHACDHLDRLIESLRAPTASMHALRHDPVLVAAADRARPLIVPARADAGEPASAPPQPPSLPLPSTAEAISKELAATRVRERREALRLSATGQLDIDLAEARIDGMLWLDTLAYHAWRTIAHLAEAAPPAGS